MVEYIYSIDTVFGSLADPTRRDILHRLLGRELTITEVAEPYDMSLAAVSKHLQILEQARLIRKRKQGRERYVSFAPAALMEANSYMQQFEQHWSERFDRLETFLKEDI